MSMMIARSPFRMNELENPYTGMIAAVAMLLMLAICYKNIIKLTPWDDLCSSQPMYRAASARSPYVIALEDIDQCLPAPAGIFKSGKRRRNMPTIASDALIYSKTQYELE